MSRPPIRNACVARGTITAGGSHPLYFVPAGYVLLLKSVAIASVGGITTTATLLVVQVPGVAVPIHKVDMDATTSFDHHQTWIALNAGDALALDLTFPNVDYWVSGALLPWFPVPGVPGGVPASAGYPVSDVEIPPSP